MTAFRILVAAAVASLAVATASAGEHRPKPAPRPIVDTPCDRHDLGPKFPPIKIPPVALPRPIGRPK